MINTHLFDQSYQAADAKTIEHSLSDFVEIVSKRKDDGISRFTYDEKFYETKVNDSEIMSDFLYGGKLDRQNIYMFNKTLNMCKCLDSEVKNINDYIKILNIKFGADKYFDVHSLWGIHFPHKKENEISTIDEEEKYHDYALSTNINNSSFWRLKESYLSNTKFISRVESDISSITGKDFNMILADLKELDSYLKKNTNNFNWREFQKITGVSISDESDTVKKDPKLAAERKYNIPGVGKVDCFLHIKTGEKRTYIFFDDNEKRMWVVYIGNHKATAKY